MITKLVRFKGEIWNVGWLDGFPAPEKGLPRVLVETERSRQAKYGGKGNTISTPATQAPGGWVTYAVWQQGAVSTEYAATMLSIKAGVMDLQGFTANQASK